MKKRLSNIELLKIISLFFISIQHIISSSNINFGIASNNLEVIIFNCFRYFGCIGNTIFVICSAYFLLDSKGTNKKKIVYIFGDVFTISIIWLIPFIFININLSIKDYIKEFFPILFQTNWFIGCYIILYLIHPLLNTSSFSFSIEKRSFHLSGFGGNHAIVEWPLSQLSIML